MTNKKTKKEIKKIVKEIKKAQENRNVDLEIILAEKLGLNFHAGKISQENGFFNNAYKNFKIGKENKDYFYSNECEEKIEELKKIIFPENDLCPLILGKKTKANEKYSNLEPIKTYSEKCDRGNWDRPWGDKIHEDLIRPFKRINGQKNYFASEKIKKFN